MYHMILDCNATIIHWDKFMSISFVVLCGMVRLIYVQQLYTVLNYLCPCTDS